MTAKAPATIFPIRHPWDATLASQMRIGIPPDENLSDVHEFKSHIPVHSMTKRSLPERQGAHCRRSEHASTARLEKDCLAWPRPLICARYAASRQTPAPRSLHHKT